MAIITGGLKKTSKMAGVMAAEKRRSESIISKAQHGAISENDEKHIVAKA